MKRSLVWTALDQALVSGGNFLTIFLGAIYLSLHDQGNFIVLLSFYFFCLIASISLVYAPVQTVYPRLNGNPNYIYTGLVYHLLLSLGLIVTVVIAINGMNYSALISISSDSIKYFMAFILFQQIADYGRRLSYVFFNSFVAFNLSAFLYIPRILSLYLVKPADLDSALMILIASNVLIAVVVTAFILLKKIKQGLIFEIALLKQHMLFSKNIFYSAPIAWTVAYTPTLVLGFFSGPVLVGVLGTLRSIVGVSNFFVEMIEVSVISQLASRKQNGEIAYVKKYFVNLIIFFSALWLVLFLLVVLFYNEGISFVGDDFRQYRPIFLLLCVGYLIYFFARIHVLYFRVFYHTETELYNSRVALVTTCFLFPLIYLFDITGAASVYVLSQLSSLLFTLKKFRFIIKE